MNKPFRTTLLALLLGAITACTTTEPPAQTHDGLVLQPDTRFQFVYLLPDAELDAYTTFGLADCSVAFRKNWLRDQNSSRLDLGSRVTQKDVDRIKDALGAMCTEQMREALQAPPPYTLVDEFEEGEAVLIIRPAIINLDINAPDTMSAGRSRSYTTSAGEMTLVIELLDGTTGQVLARVADRRRGSDFGTMQWTNSVTNRADANRALKRWAGMMREGLDKVVGR
ncbi:DUF3313 family protein [Mangrovimicrobium sediminis]|nr:DUF3313 family protein [Haliea sp. SAOS-164]